jgi:hypothetical protein
VLNVPFVDLHTELVNLVLFAECLLKVGLCTGFIFLPIVVLVHDNWKRGKQ